METVPGRDGAQKASQALHVLDRFHIVAYMNKAIDHVRAQEARDLKAKGYEPVLKQSPVVSVEASGKQDRSAKH